MNFAALLECTAVGLRPTSFAPQKRIKPTTEPRQDSTYPKAKTVQTNGAISHLKKLACRSLLEATHQNLAAEIGMIPVEDFQLLPDTGRMNG